METLADALPREQERVRELIPIYESLGVSGTFAVAMMKISLREAEKAAARGDVVAMLRALEDLRGYNV
jgi:hypothetical protein